MEGEIRSFLAQNFVLGADMDRLPATASLIETGLIDSTGVLELVAFLEETYAISIADSELVPEHLDTIESIVRFLAESDRPAADPMTAGAIEPDVLAIDPERATAEIVEALRSPSVASSVVEAASSASPAASTVQSRPLSRRARSARSERWRC